MTPLFNQAATHFAVVAFVVPVEALVAIAQKLKLKLSPLTQL